MIDILELFPNKNNTSETIKKLNKDLFFFNNKVYSKEKLLLENIDECEYLKNDILLISYGKRITSSRVDLLYALYDVKKEKIIAGDYRSVDKNKNSIELIRVGRHDIYLLNTNVLYKKERIGFKIITDNLTYVISTNKVINKYAIEILDINKVRETVKEKYPGYNVVTSLYFNSDDYLVKVVYQCSNTNNILFEVIIDKSEKIIYKENDTLNYD